MDSNTDMWISDPEWDLAKLYRYDDIRICNTVLRITLTFLSRPIIMAKNRMNMMDVDLVMV